MCFSAPASFTASAVLATIGILCVSRTKTNRLKPFALIPLFFALQQFSEGMVWLTLANPTSLSLIAKDVFVFFAYVFWPVWVPFSLWLAEPQMMRKQILALCMGIGLMLVCFLALTIPAVKAIPYGCSIQYTFSFPQENFGLEGVFYKLALLFYGLAVLGPLLFSSLKGTTIIGILVGVTAVLVYKIDHLYFASMWCFFAALISMGLFFVLQKADKKKKVTR